MKLAFEDEASDLMQEFFPGVAVDQNAEHVTSESAVIYYDDNKGKQYKVTLDVSENFNEEDEDEADGVIVNYCVYQRELNHEDWNLITSDSREMDLMP
jgi:hypothetical protein